MYSLQDSGCTYICIASSSWYTLTQISLFTHQSLHTVGKLRNFLCGKINNLFSMTWMKNEKKILIIGSDTNVHRRLIDKIAKYLNKFSKSVVRSTLHSLQ